MMRSSFQLLAVGVAAAFWVSMTLSLAAWVARDAQARGSSQPTTWALAAVFTPVGLPYYLYKRYRHPGLDRRYDPPTRRERAVATWASANLGALLGIGLFSPPDPYTQILLLPFVFVSLLPLAYLLMYRGTYRSLRERIGG